MKITPLASESMGTRSMATFVETSDAKILIDPGVALGPSRYGLPPHRLELQRMEEHWKKIKKCAEKAEILAVTHYHYDHHDPNVPEVYDGKTVLLKHPTEKINYSQKSRASFFLKQIKGLPQRLEYSDGREFSFGDTTLKFSKPVFHGTDSKLGYVTEASVRTGGSCFVFTSDVEGPSAEEQTEFIISENPNVVLVDGPLSYMLGYRYSRENLQKSIDNLIKIIENTKVERIIVDHHLLRDIKWKERIAPVFAADAIPQGRRKSRGLADAKVKISTAAEFLGKKNDLLEARRKELFAADKGN